MMQDRRRAEQIPEIMTPDHRRLEFGKMSALFQDGERGETIPFFNTLNAPISVFGFAIRLNRGGSGWKDFADIRLVGARDKQAVRGNQRRKFAKFLLDLLQIVVNVGMVEFDARDHAGCRTIMQEFRRFVKIGGVVFVSFHHEKVPVADAIGRLKIR